MRKRVYESSSFSSSEVAVRVGCSHGNNASNMGADIGYNCVETK